jgi:tetratricopeptide (TPR) repeat protein
MVQPFQFSGVTIRRALLLLAVLLVASCGSKEERAQSYYDHGMKLLVQHDDIRAGIEFRNALQLNRNMVGAWRALAEIEERNKNLGSLIEIQRTIVELVPNDVDAKLRLARVLFLTNAMNDALNFVNAAVDLDNRNASALGIKAMILFKRNDHDDRKEALSTAQATLEIDPANVEATVVLAAERLARGDTEGALMILDRASAAHEKNIGIQLFKIKILEQIKNLEQVETVLRKLIEYYPQEPAFRKALVKLYLYQKRPDDAEKELRALATANPNDAGLQMEVIHLLGTIKGPAAARQELEARIKAGGQVSAYQLALAEFEFAQGNVKDSVSLLENLGSNADTRETALAAKAKLAEFYLSTKRFDEAEALVSQILRQDSRNASGLKLRAQVRLERGQLDAAVADLREALNDSPRSTELMLLLAAAYERTGSIELAEKQYADSTKVSDFNAAIGLNYVAFLRRRGNVEHAEDILAKLAERSPNNIAVLSAWAQLRLARQNWIGAQEIADAIRRIGNDNGLADEILVQALNGQKKYDESISILEKAYAANPGAVPLIKALVNELAKAQQFDKAVTFLQTALKSNPLKADLYVMLGAVQLLKNAPDQALKNFRLAVQLEPKNVNAYRALADFYLSEKNADVALKAIREGLNEQPNSVTLHKALAEILVMKGDYEPAIAEYEYLLKQEPSSLVVANDLASLLSDHRTDKASLDRAHSLAAVLRSSPVPSFEDTLGWIDYQRGDNKSALSLLEEAAKKLPNVGLIRYHLAMSYIAADQLEKASEQLNRALALTNSVELEQKVRAAQEKLAEKESVPK